MKTYSILGGKQKVNYSGCTIEKETEKAYLIATTDSEGSYLHDYNITFWLPKSVFNVGLEDKGSFGLQVTLPYYFDVNIKKQAITNN